MPFFKIKDPFNELSTEVRKNTLCFQLDRYCSMNGEFVAAFHLNDPNGTMTEYVYKDGLVYLNATTMKLIAQLLQNSNVSNTLYEYLDKIRIDMEKRRSSAISILACFFTSPPRDLMPAVTVASTTEGVKVAQVFKDIIRP